jgi:hypothetical protein
VRDFLRNINRAHERLKGHCAVSDRRNVAADVDPARTSLSENMNVQNAAAAHLASLFADKAYTRSTRYETMLHHENR